jgi:hypothetical protein
VAFTGFNAANTCHSGTDVVWDETGNDTLLDYVDGGLAYSFSTNHGPVAYRQFSYVVTASSSLTRLDFHGIEDSGAMHLDNGSLTVARRRRAADGWAGG